MNNTRTVKLSFDSPVHFGTGRLSGGNYVCDAGTLFSALYIEALKSGAASDLLDAARSGDLLISDAFPYIGIDLYLPKPMIAREIKQSDSIAKDTLAKKATKKLSFIRCSEYQAFLNGTMDSCYELKKFEEGLGQSFLQTKANLTRIHKPEAEPYFVGGYRYRNNCGLYFLVQGSYDLDPLLEQLQYSGLGGERSSGFGRFHFEVIDANPVSSATAKTSIASHVNVRNREHGHQMKLSSTLSGARRVLLTTAAPSQDELSDYLLQDARYKLVRRGGFVQSTSHYKTQQKKRDLYLFLSGSVFRREFEGDVFNVNATPGAHPVYRYARAMWMEV